MATSADAPPRYVFLLGTGRCGSSLVHEVLARHPEVGFVSNLDDRLPSGSIRRWNGAIYRRMPQSFTTKGRVRFAPSEAYRALERAVSPAISTPVRDLVAADATPWVAKRFRDYFERQAASQGTPVFSHKFTGWPRTRFIQAVLPDARFVHVVRDGRAVANSLLQMPWWKGYRGPGEWGWGPLPPAYQEEWEASGRSFPVLAALEWKVLMDAFGEARAEVPAERWLEIRYEDFLVSSRETLSPVLELAGLAWTPAFERAVAGYRLDGGRADAYRRDLAPSDVAAVERVLAPWLEARGYVVGAAGAGGWAP